MFRDINCSDVLFQSIFFEYHRETCYL